MKMNFNKGLIDMTHGAGGRAMNDLIEQLMLQYFDNSLLAQKSDQACFNVPSGRLAMSTDSYVISPIFFPGGDIGSLAVHGTVNDVSLSGATPLYLSAGFIIEEGFPLVQLEEIVKSMANAAKLAKVKIITGDTKVVEKGKGDGIFINTTGIGILPESIDFNQPLKPGDKILINGDIADHGIAVMSKRKGLSFTSEIQSDSAALNDLIQLIKDAGIKVKCMRDPTRGGVAATLNEWVDYHNVSIQVDEASLPIKESVKGACELLGIDPLFVANEGKALIACAKEDADKLLELMQSHPLGETSAIIAEVIPSEHNYVAMQTEFGSIRRVDWLAGEQLPRIC